MNNKVSITFQTTSIQWLRQKKKQLEHKLHRNDNTLKIR